MASKTDFDRGVADRGVPSIEVPLFPLLELSKRGIKSQMQADDRPVLAVLPDGSGYVGPAWKAELVRYEMDQRMAWDRELKTGQNVSGLVGGLAHGVAKAWGGDPHAASDVGALVDATLLASYSEHTLNTQTV